MYFHVQVWVFNVDFEDLNIFESLPGRHLTEPSLQPLWEQKKSDQSFPKEEQTKEINLSCLVFVVGSNSNYALSLWFWDLFIWSLAFWDSQVPT